MKLRLLNRFAFVVLLCLCTICCKVYQYTEINPVDPSLLPEPSYYLELLTETFGDIEESYQAGDSFKAIVNEYTVDEHRLSGTFSVTVQSGDSISINGAEVVVDEIPLVISNNQIVDGEFDLQSVKNIIKSYMSFVMESGFEIYGNSDYFILRRNISDTYITAFDSNWTQKEFQINQFEMIREKAEHSIEAEASFRILLSADERVEIEGAYGNHIEPYFTYSFIGESETGEKGEVSEHGPEAEITPSYYLELVADTVYENLDNTTDKHVKAILAEPYDYDSFVITGNFNADIAADSLVSISDAYLEINGETIIIHDNEVISGESASLEMIKLFILQYAESIDTADNRQADYYLVSYHPSIDTVFALNLDWELEEFGFSEHQFIVEKPESSTDQKESIHFMLEGSIPVEIVADKTDDYGFEIRYSKLGEAEHGSWNGNLESGPETTLDAKYYCNLISGLYPELTLMSGDTISAIIDSYTYTGKEISGVFHAAVSSDGALRISDAMLAIDEADVIVVDDSVKTGLSTIDEIHEIIRSYIESILTSVNTVSNHDYFRLSREHSGNHVYAYTPDWDFEEYEVATLQLLLEKTESETGINEILYFTLYGKVPVEVAAEKTDDSGFNITYSKLGDTEQGTWTGHIASGPETALDANYYCSLISGLYPELTLMSGDTVSAIIDNYDYDGRKISGVFHIVMSSDDSLSVSDAMLKVDGNDVTVMNDSVKSGDSSIDEIKTILVAYIESMLTSSLDSENNDYFKLSREYDSTQIYIYSPDWSFGKYEITEHQILLEKTESEREIREGLHFTLNGKVPVEVVADKIDDSGFNIIFSKLGDTVHGSWNGELESGPESVLDASYYCSLIYGLYPERELMSGDSISAIVESYTFDGKEISGAFHAKVSTDSVSILDAVLEVDGSNVVIQQNSPPTGFYDVTDLKNFIHSYSEAIVSSYGALNSQDYFLLERKTAQQTVYAYNQNWSLEEYVLKESEMILEKREDSNELREAMHFILDGNQDIEIESEIRSDDFDIRYSKFGDSETGHLSDKLPIGPEKVIDGEHYYKCVSSLSQLNNLMVGDEIKAVINDEYIYPIGGLRVSGAFNVAVAGTNRGIQISDAILDINGSKVTVIDDAVKSGNYDIDKISDIINAYIESMINAGSNISNNDYFMISKKDYSLHFYAYSPDWELEIFVIDEFRVCMEKTESSDEISRRMHFKLNGSIPIEIEGEDTVDSEPVIVYSRIGNETYGSLSESLEYGPEISPDALYYYDVLSNLYGNGRDGYRAGDRFAAVLLGYSSVENAKALEGYFDATVSQATDKILEIVVNDGHVESYDTDLEVKGKIISSNSNTPEEALIDFMNAVYDEYTNGAGYAFLERKINNQYVYVYDATWSLQKYLLDEFSIKASKDNIVLYFLLNGADDIELEAVIGNPVYSSSAEIVYYRYGNHEEGERSGFEIDWPSSSDITPQYYLKRIRDDFDINDNDMSIIQQDDVVTFQFNNYYYYNNSATNEYISGNISAKMDDGNLKVQDADFTLVSTYSNYHVQIQKGVVTSYSGGNGNIDKDLLITTANRFINDALDHMNSSSIVSFEHSRDIDKNSIALPDKNYIYDLYSVDVLKLCRQKNGVVELTCELTSGRKFIRFTAIGNQIDTYEQGC